MPPAWTNCTEGEGTWSPYLVVAHLIHCEKTEWIPRLRIVLEHGKSRAFDPFDGEAQFRDSVGKTPNELLDEFSEIRQQSLTQLDALQLQPGQLALEGMHPAFGAVTVRQLLATWAAHDLQHILQTSRVMAKRYRSDVGPWTEYLSVLR